MKFRMLLWILGQMMKRASKKSAAFQKTLKDQNLTFQLSSKDGVARHFVVKDEKVYPKSGTTSEPTFELSFSSAKKGFEILTAKKSQVAFMKGVQEKDIIASGDLSKIMWFQSMTAAMKR
ncbi:helicase [Endozoicomonas ascidiicola]|uniref:helicase n=1 Tax=Endozoicomonas ascidiicola TaxID=1698521 RepID=UPI00083552AE|nr:helicase [Endozoicomonas ascidiicola]